VGTGEAIKVYRVVAANASSLEAESWLVRLFCPNTFIP
jgi:hypothetical protein